MAYFIDMRAFILWLYVADDALPRRWWRTVFLLALIPLMLVVLAQLAPPPQASYFMLVILVLSVCEQVAKTGRPGAFNLIGVIFPALCVMVLSTNVFVFLLLLVTVIFYAGVYTLRINDMPLSGLRIRLLPIVWPYQARCFSPLLLLFSCRASTPPPFLDWLPRKPQAGSVNASIWGVFHKSY